MKKLTTFNNNNNKPNFKICPKNKIHKIPNLHKKTLISNNNNNNNLKKNHLTQTSLTKLNPKMQAKHQNK